MASLLAKTSKKVEELGKGVDVEDPACVVPPVGGNSAKSFVLNWLLWKEMKFMLRRGCISNSSFHITHQYSIAD